MKLWIEISSEYRFENKLSKEEGLYAPASTRHKTMMEDVKTGDIILHHIVSHGTIKKANKSTIIGISIAASDMEIKESKITVKLTNTQRLPCPIKLREISKINKKSDLLKKLFIVNFQKFLGEISFEDLINIFNVHEENMRFLLTDEAYKIILKKGP